MGTENGRQSSGECRCKKFPTGLVLEYSEDCPLHWARTVDEVVELDTTTPEDAAMEVKQVIEAYLRSLRTQIWPPHTFFLTQEDRLLDATEWLYGVMQDINGVRNMALGSSKELHEVATMYRRLREGETYGEQKNL